MMIIGDKPKPADDGGNNDQRDSARIQYAPPSAIDSAAAMPSRWPFCASNTPRKRQRTATFAAFVGFGLASWIMTNAAYIELGVFLRVLPEKYGIFAYSIFALQSANIYPFLYMVLNSKEQRMRHTTAIWILLAIGVLAALLMSLLWRQTATVLGKQHSVAMLMLTHMGGLVSATSSVVFYPYVGTFPSIYTSALATGEGLSGSIAALIGLLQKPYDDTSMRFSVQVFYFLCALMMVLSLLSFAFLERHPFAQAAKTSVPRHTTSHHHHQQGEIELQRPTAQVPTNEASPLVHGNGNGNGNGGAADQSLSSSFAHHDQDQPEILPSTTTTFRRSFALVWSYLLCHLVLAAFSFGILPSVMPYIYKKYAPIDDREAATSRYQTLASIAALILDPIARVLTSWVKVYRVREFTAVLVVVATTLLAFSLHPHPLGATTANGFALPLVAHVGYLVLYAYTQTMVYLTLKRISEASPATVVAHRVYQWGGFATQIGAFVGTLAIFPLIYLCEDLFLTTSA